MRFVYQLILCVSFFSIACKSTTKLFEQGQYDRAVYSAIDDLKKRPGNSTAAQILPNAYREAVTNYENSIHNAAMSHNPGRFDVIFSSYRALQNMYNAIAATPAANGIVIAKSYSNEMNAAAEDAADYHYQLGSGLLNQNPENRLTARKAFEEFRAVEQYIPGYKDVEQLKGDAYNLAITNILVNKFDQRFGSYNIDGNYFQNDILNTLNNIGNNYFNRFYNVNDPASRQVRADEYMDINMYDITFGKLATDNYSYNVEKKVTVKSDKAAGTSTTETVTATVNVTRRVISARAMMDYRISDAVTQRMITFDRLPGQYNWEKLTGKYSGDSRALSDKDWAIIRGEYNNQPDHNELYRALTKQIMNEFTSRMRSIYGR